MNFDGMPDHIGEVDDLTVRALLTFAWLEPEVGFDAVMVLVANATGLGVHEDDVRRDVTAMVVDVAAGMLWLEDPEQAVWDFLGRGESHTLTAYADQFAAERFVNARVVGERLATAHSMAVAS